jgi:D-tyrosyl-tRNA(Tyr) deacylase
MRVVVQRVSSASVTVDETVIGAIGQGLMVLVGFTSTDTGAELTWMADKLVGLRIFGDDQGMMNLDLKAIGGQMLIVSQFTLYGDASRGRRPSFINAARPEQAIPLYEQFIAAVRSHGITVATGEFGADMKVSLVNDGPVTLALDRDPQ